MSESGAIEATASAERLRVRFRLPRSSYLAVVLLAFGVSALLVIPWLGFLYALPLAAAAFVARRGTTVDGDAVTVHALLRSRSFGWEQVSGLSIDAHGRVWLALGRPAPAMIALPCVTVAALPVLAEASGGRLPALPAARIKSAPTRRRR